MLEIASQTSLDDQKPPSGMRFNTLMQTSTQPVMPDDRFLLQQQGREFDLWLQRELSRLHSDVLHEPVPEKLLSIIESSGSLRR